MRGERVAGRAVAAAGRQLNGLVPTIRRQPATWPSPDELLDGLRAGQCEPGGASGGEVTSPAVNCLDLPDRRTPAQVMAHSERAAGVVCVEWPAAPAYRPHRITAAGPAPILVVGTTHDTAAPCDWAVSAAGC